RDVPFVETPHRRPRGHAEMLGRRERGVSIHVLKEKSMHRIGAHPAVRENLLDRRTYALQPFAPDSVRVDARVVLSEREILRKESRRPAPARGKFAPELLDTACLWVDHRPDE